MSVVSNNILAGASGQGGAGYAIERSVRFNSGDTSFLNRTPSAAGNRRTWTWSGWIKRSRLGGTAQEIFRSTSGGSTAWMRLLFETDDKIHFHETYNDLGGTTQVYRDPSAWYHIVLVFDTTQATNNVVLYVNNVQQRTWSLTQNFEGAINSANEHVIANYAALYSDFYLADIHFIDGQALPPTDFGETDDNGVWQPKEFAGEYSLAEANGATSPSVYYSEAPSYQTIANINSGSGPVAVNNANGGYIRVKFASAQTSVTTIKFTGGGYAIGAAWEIFVNGNTVTTGTTSGGWGEQTVTIPSVDITEIELRTASSGYALGQLKFNDTLVPGTPSLGTPASGTNSFHLDFADNSSNAALGTDTSGVSPANTWTVNNLQAAGSGWNQSQTWSTVASITSGSAYSGRGLDRLFNSVINNNDPPSTAFLEQGSSGLVVTFSSAITATSSIKMWIGSYSSYTTGELYVNGSNFDVSNVVGNNTAPVLVDLGVTSLTSFGVRGNQNIRFSGLVVDGQLLVDSGISDPLAAGIDSLVDTPTNGDTASDTGAGGEITGNYATWNPLDKGSAITLTNGNLDIAQSGSGFCKATIAVSSGKWFWEISKTDAVDSIVGIALASTAADANYLGSITGTAGFTTATGSPLATSPFSQGGSGTIGAMSNGSIIGFALDCDNGSLKLYLNGSLLTANHFTFSPGLLITPALGTNVAAGAYPTNFGQRAFSHPVSGYKSLNTANLSSTIADGSLYFDTKVYTGNGGTKIIPDFKFLSDLVWIKNRGATTDHVFYDSVRGFNNTLWPNLTDTEHDWGSDAVTPSSTNLTVNRSDERHNKLDDTYVAWTWDAGTSNTTIAAGGLNSSVYDQSQTWSSGTFFNANGNAFYNSGGSAAELFDDVEQGSGSSGDYALPVNGGTFTLTFTQFSSASTVTLKLAGTGNALKINGSFVTIGSSSDSTQTFNVSGLTTIEWLYNGSDYCYLGSVAVDGVKLIDSGITPTTNVPSIASTVRANPSAGFSIVTYTGTGSSATVGHSLNVAPAIYIIKSRSGSTNWQVSTTVIDGSHDYLILNSTAAKQNSGRAAPTSSVFSTGSGSDLNGSGSTYVAYCFAPVEGYSAMGSYEGNGSSSNGPFVYTGFKVSWLMIKNADGSGDWSIIDSKRSPFNRSENYLLANSSGAEGSPGYFRDHLSNGFKIKDNGSGVNTNGQTYIYLAFASNPFASNGGLAR